MLGDGGGVTEYDKAFWGDFFREALAEIQGLWHWGIANLDFSHTLH